MAIAIPSEFGEWSSLQIVYLTLSVAVAGFVRGYSGFGVSLAAVPMLTVVLKPLDAIPIALAFEVILTLGLLHRCRQEVAWPTVSRLAIGALAGTPVGIYALASLPADQMRLALSLILLASVALIWRRSQMSWHLNTPVTISFGFASGLLSGGTAMSGPPIVMYFLSSPISPSASRASMMMFFLFSASMALAAGIGSGLYQMHAFLLALTGIPILLVGAALGSMFFARSPAVSYRKVALLILAAIGVLAFSNAMLGLT